MGRRRCQDGVSAWRMCVRNSALDSPDPGPPVSRFFGIPSVRQLSRSQGVLIVDRSPWLSHRVAVTVYVLENGIECWLCEGFVLNVQYNELVQISVQADEAENRSEKSLWDTLEKTDKKSILIKPGSYLGGR